MIKHLAFLVGLLLPSHSESQTTARWSWFRASSVVNDWWITRGQADVTITRGSFKATLWDGTDPKFVRLSLGGSIEKNVLRVKVTVNNSDDDPFDTRGTLTRSCWNGGGREAIVLTSGLGAIGIVRELPAGRCIPVS